MLTIKRHSKFKSDSKKLIKSGNFSESDDKKLFEIIKNIAMSRPLELKHRDHFLTGNWKKHRECHIKPDLLLIYKIEDNVLHLIRIGSHSELF